jgi:hypothetical protein
MLMFPNVVSVHKLMPRRREPNRVAKQRQRPHDDDEDDARSDHEAKASCARA